MILDDIVKVKRTEVAGRKAAQPLADLEGIITALPPARDFSRALVPGAIIAEVKRRSPSRGVLRGGFRSSPDRPRV